MMPYSEISPTWKQRGELEKTLTLLAHVTIIRIGYALCGHGLSAVGTSHPQAKAMEVDLRKRLLSSALRAVTSNEATSHALHENSRFPVTP